MKSDPVTITLTEDEALVLFEWLARNDDAKLLPTEHPAEQRVLWNVEAMLEKQLNVFAPNYRDMLNRARESIVDESQ